MSEINDGTLAAFVDGELEPETMRDVEKLIAADAEAREKVRLLRLSPMLIRAAFRDPALESVSPSLMKAVEPRRVVAPRSWVRRWTGLAMAASLLLAAFLGGQQFGADRAGSGSATEQLMGEIAEYHVVYARESEHRVEVPSSRRNHIETWLGDRLHRKLQIPELATAGLDFEGARMLVVDGHPVAQLMYTKPGDENRPLALCITFGDPAEAAVRTLSRDGVNLAGWRSKGYTYVLVGWAETGVLSQLAAEIAPQLDRI